MRDNYLTEEELYKLLTNQTDSHERKTEVLWMKGIEPDLFTCAGGGIYAD
jgi:hypothetical protein